MLYGAWPGTSTGELSVPHQNPGGPSRSIRIAALAAATLAPAVTVDVATPPITDTSATQTSKSSHNVS
jgi:hypothetical protein